MQNKEIVLIEVVQDLGLALEEFLCTKRDHICQIAPGESLHSFVEMNADYTETSTTLKWFD